MIIQWNTETDKEKETIIRNLGESESRKETMRTKKKNQNKKAEENRQEPD